VPKRGTVSVPTDISIKLPPGTYGRIAPRSGCALRGITVDGGF
jgi:dUTPase